MTRPTVPLASEIAELPNLSVSDLHARWRRAFAEPAPNHHRVYLWRRLAWRLQERAHGGLSPRARVQLAALLAELPAGRAAPLPRLDALIPPPPAPRDPRLPPAGTVLTRVHRGIEHRVLVRADDFEYDGRAWPTLSAIARAITGTRWNGFAFFGCAPAAAEAG